MFHPLYSIFALLIMMPKVMGCRFSFIMVKYIPVLLKFFLYICVFLHYMCVFQKLARGFFHPPFCWWALELKILGLLPFSLSNTKVKSIRYYCFAFTNRPVIINLMHLSFYIFASVFFDKFLEVELLD